MNLSENTNKLKIKDMKGFIKDCLLFQSKDKVYWIIGILTWINILLLILNVSRLFIILQN